MTPLQAYQNALTEGPSDETRVIACEDEDFAYMYALIVDKGPREDTRKAACRGAVTAYLYALMVDKGFHDSTWKAVRKHDALYVVSDQYRKNVMNLRYW